MSLTRDGRRAPRQRRFVGPAVVLTAAALAAAGCGGSDSGGSPPGAPTTSPAKAAASVPASALVQSGQLQFCSDISPPPLESYGPGHKPQGSDIDIGTEIAKQIGRASCRE